MANLKKKSRSANAGGIRDEALWVRGGAASIAEHFIIAAIERRRRAIAHGCVRLLGDTIMDVGIARSF